MGTRAAFFIGDPREGGEWVGCKAWDGYPCGPCGQLALCVSADEFRAKAETLADATPDSGGWPYPWSGDVFLTDHVYWWAGDHVEVTQYHSGPLRLSDDVEFPEEENPELHGVPAPTEYDRNQPDSIIMLRLPPRD